MAIAFVQAKGAQSSGAVLTVSATFDAASASGNLIVVGVSQYAPIAHTVGDTVNTYTKDVEKAADSGSCKAGVWHTYATTGATLTITVDNGANYKYTSLGMAEFSGVDSGTAPLTNGDNNADVATTTPKAGSVDSTSLGNGALYVAAWSTATTTTMTPDGGFSEIYEAEGGGNEPVSVIYQIQGTAGALNPGWTLGSSIASTACVAVFKATAGGGGVTIPVFMFHYMQQRSA